MKDYDMQKIITVVLVVLLIYELLKYVDIFKTCGNLYEHLSNVEYFSSSPTSYIVSNSESESGQDKYLNVNEELLIGTQKQGTLQRQWMYNYVRGPINKYIAINAIIVENGRRRSIKTTLIKFTKNTYIVPNLLGLNGALINESIKHIYYHITFLSDNQYQIELKRQKERIIQLNLYNQCLTKYKGMGWSNNRIISRCNDQFNI